MLRKNFGFEKIAPVLVFVGKVLEAHPPSISSGTSSRPQPSDQNRGSGPERAGCALVVMGAVGVSQHSVGPYSGQDFELMG